MIREIYLSKESRDKRYHVLKRQYRFVKKSMSYNQLLHPQFIEDFEGPEKLDVELGNTVYKTHFSRLYKIEASNDKL